MIILDDHLVRDFVAGELPQALVSDHGELATTNLWLFRLASALANQDISGALSGSVASGGDDQVGRFLRELAERVELFTIVPMRELVWSMADLQPAPPWGRTGARHGDG